MPWLFAMLATGLFVGAQAQQKINPPPTTTSTISATQIAMFAAAGLAAVVLIKKIKKI